MRFEFQSRKLALLYYEEKGARKYPREVVDAFFDAMSVIEAAKDTRDLRALHSYHFEHLSGKRKGESSIRLNDQYRLIMKVVKDEKGNYLLLLEIADYH